MECVLQVIPGAHIWALGYTQVVLKLNPGMFGRIQLYDVCTAISVIHMHASMMLDAIASYIRTAW